MPVSTKGSYPTELVCHGSLVFSVKRVWPNLVRYLVPRCGIFHISSPPSPPSPPSPLHGMGIIENNASPSPSPNP